MSVGGNQRRGIVLAAGTAVQSANVYMTNSNTWYQLIASTSTPIYIVALGLFTSGAQVDIGTGGAGSETVVLSSYIYPINNTTNAAASPALVFPLRIPSGTRVAVRAGSGTSGCSIMYVNESAVV